MLRGVNRTIYTKHNCNSSLSNSSLQSCRFSSNTRCSSNSSSKRNRRFPSKKLCSNERKNSSNIIRKKKIPSRFRSSNRNPKNQSSSK